MTFTNVIKEVLSFGAASFLKPVFTFAGFSSRIIAGNALRSRMVVRKYYKGRQDNDKNYFR